MAEEDPLEKNEIDPDFTWLVQRRSEIQELLLNLYQFHLKNSERLKNGFTLNVYHLLVGAAFSLWRAVFLCEPDTQAKKMVDHSKVFLEILIGDNAINYAQDKKTKSWMAGYYINNAFFRIEEVINCFASHEGGANPECCIPFNEFREAVKEGVHSTKRQTACEKSLVAAKEALLKLHAIGALGETDGT